MSTELYAGNISAAQGGNVYIKAGTGTPAGDVIIEKRTDSTISSLKLMSNGTNYVGWKAPTSSTAVVWTLPSADGSSGQVLQTNGAATLSFASMPSTYERFSVAGGANRNPDISYNSSFIKTTGVGNATGTLSNGITDGQINNFIGQSIVTPYVLDVSTSTNVLDYNGSTVYYFTFTNTGNTASVVWNNDGSNWFIVGTGVTLS
jgi:hypothetical protein